MKDKFGQPIEIGDVVFCNSSRNILRVVSYRNTCILACTKICNINGKIPKTKIGLEREHYLYPQQCVLITEENFDQFIDSEIESLNVARSEIKPLVKLQARYKRAAPLA